MVRRRRRDFFFLFTINKCIPLFPFLPLPPFTLLCELLVIHVDHDLCVWIQWISATGP